MPVRILLVPALLMLLVAFACTNVGVRQERDSTQPGEVAPPTAGGPSTQPAPAQPDLPFSLIINEQVVGPDRRAAVPEGRGVVIQFISTDIVPCELRVQHPDGEPIMLGAWQADMTNFYHVFPYGENHLILAYGDRVYDFLVVAGAPEPTRGDAKEGCAGTLVDFNPAARWEYRETVRDDYPAHWEYRVENWTHGESGDIGLTLVMERSIGVERKVDRTVEVELICTGEVILVTGAVEREEGKEAAMIYDEGTLFVPSSFAEGVQWDRRGTMVITYPQDETYTLRIVETYRCVGEQRVSVEAGEFDAFRVDYTFTGSGSDGEFSHGGAAWYVPGLGRILTEGDTEDVPRRELVSFDGVSLRR